MSRNLRGRLRLENVQQSSPGMGQPSAATMGRGPCGESREAEARPACLWPLLRALAFTQRNIEPAGIQAEGFVTWLRVTSVCRAEGGAQRPVLCSHQGQMPRAHFLHQGSHKRSECGCDAAWWTQQDFLADLVQGVRERGESGLSR